LLWLTSLLPKPRHSPVCQAFTGLKEQSILVREALKALIERERAQLGGSQRD
jgi:hypothetical protein